MFFNPVNKSNRVIILDDVLEYAIVHLNEVKKMRINFKDYPREVFDVMMSGNILIIYEVNDDVVIFYDYGKDKIRVHGFKYRYKHDERWTDPNPWQKMICGRLWHEYLARTISKKSEKEKDNENI